LLERYADGAINFFFQGIVVTAKAKADERVRLVKNKNKALEEQLQLAKNKIETQEKRKSSDRTCGCFNSGSPSPLN